MPDACVTYLQLMMKSGFRVWWKDGDGHLVPVFHIGRRDNEPGLCAFVDKGTGHYLALDGCCPEDFWLTTANLIHWPV